MSAVGATADNELRMQDFLPGAAQIQQEAALGVGAKQHLFHHRVPSFFDRTN